MIDDAPVPEGPVFVSNVARNRDRADVEDACIRIVTAAVSWRDSAARPLKEISGEFRIKGSLAASAEYNTPSRRRTVPSPLPVIVPEA